MALQIGGDAGAMPSALTHPVGNAHAVNEEQSSDQQEPGNQAHECGLRSAQQDLGADEPAGNAHDGQQR